MTGRRIRLLAMVALAGAALAVAAFLRLEPGVPADAAPVPRPPTITPDYGGVTVPPNIAPMNFVIREQGRRFITRFTASGSEGFTIASGADGRVIIPPDRWRRLLSAARGGEMHIDVYARQADGRWTAFASIANTVAAEPVDSHLMYRLLIPNIHGWHDIALHQQDLSTGAVEPVLHSDWIGGDCCNCHTLYKNRPDTMLFHVRPYPAAEHSGTFIVREGHVAKVDTRTSTFPSPAGFASWHPSGKFAVVSVNRIKLFAHGTGVELREQCDLSSHLATLDVATGQMSFPPALQSPGHYDTFPAWSADGRQLYFCRADAPWPESVSSVPHDRYQLIKYDLARATYDGATGQFGRPEIVLSSQAMMRSILEPKISPDGRWLIFAACGFGDVPIYKSESDLYLLDLATLDATRAINDLPGPAGLLAGCRALPDVRRMACNSDQCESWHNWSSNGRWVVFSSKRGNGLYARPYLVYIDARGREGKPFVVPQEDPEWYDSCLKTYNLPELMTGPVAIPPRQMVEAMHGPPATQRGMPVTGATPERGSGGE